MLKNIYIVLLFLFVGSPAHTLCVSKKSSSTSSKKSFNKTVIQRTPKKTTIQAEGRKDKSPASRSTKKTLRVQPSLTQKTSSPCSVQPTPAFVAEIDPSYARETSRLLKTAVWVTAKKRAEHQRKTTSSSLPLPKKKIQRIRKRQIVPVRRKIAPKPVIKKKASVESVKPVTAHAEREKAHQQALFIWPIRLDEFWISSFFGPRKKPTGGWGYHSGLDLAACKGTLVHAAGEGVVTEATFMPGYGNYVLIVHNEEYKTRYAHLDKILVKRGQNVLCGDLVGKVGATGTVRKTTKNGSGSHLHFEVYQQNKRVNPLYFLA